MMTKRTKQTVSAILAAFLMTGTFAVSATAEETASRRIADYTGAGTVIAIIDAGFDVTHDVFAASPARPRITKNKVAAVLGEAYETAYVSEKIPLAADYAGTGVPESILSILPQGTEILPAEDTPFADTDVSNLSDMGTSVASLAAGSYKGAGDIPQEDGTVLHEKDFYGAAPDAQLLFLKAAADGSDRLLSSAVIAAVRDAVRLDVTAICLNVHNMEITDGVKEALSDAASAGIPVFTGTGDVSTAVQSALYEIPAAMIDRSTLPLTVDLPGVTAVGAAADPYAKILSFTLGETEIYYLDSSADYVGYSFAEAFAGQAVPVVTVPGVGTAADYDGLTLTGAIAVVRRGEISFVEKAAHAAFAGAVGMIVIDNGGGLSRMALEGTTIPAVMISEENGALFTDVPADAHITLSEAEPGVADFSARGTTADFMPAVALVAYGENVRCAVRDGYAVRSSTALAAAAAAGYFARAVEYLRSAGISSHFAPALLAATAQPMTDASGNVLSSRAVGAGILSAEGTYPTTWIMGKTGDAVSGVGAMQYNTVPVLFSLTNASDAAETYTFDAAFTTDAVDEDGMLTGETVPVEGLQASFRVGGGNVTAMQDGTVTVAPGATVRIYMQIAVPRAVQRSLTARAPYGAFLDGIITCRTETETVTHPVTMFWGDPAGAPITDKTVYDGEAPILKGTSLAVRTSADGYARPIGALQPYLPDTAYDTAYNIVSPAEMKDGALELHLTALRRINSVTARFFDSAGRLVAVCEHGAVERYLTTGERAVVPLWNFAAAEEEEYLFPDGAYSLEVLFTAADGGEETLVFPLYVDSEKPTVTDVTIGMRDGRMLVSVSAADNAALGALSVYDLAAQYSTAAGTKESASGETEATLAFDITGYNGESPLYVEVRDYAGGYVIRRFTKEDVVASLAGAP